MSTLELGNVWHQDHHVIHLLLEKSELVILEVTCPGTGECVHRQTSCVVKHFLGRFGLECNVGSCVPSGEMEIAWTLQGERDDLDLSQVWVIPLNDDLFAAWVVTQ